MAATSPSPYPNSKSHRKDSQVSGTDSRTSSDSTRSHRTSISSQRSISDSSIPIPAPYARITRYDPDAPPAYVEREGVDEKEAESVQQMERERRIRKRDYAVEMSKIMGRQLVQGLKAPKGSSAGAAG